MDENIVVSLEVAQSQIYAFLIDGFELAERILLIGLGAHCKLAILYILVVEEVVSKVTEVFKEGALHEGDLIIYARKLSNFIDEIEKSLRDAHDLCIHDLEQLSKQKSRDFYEVDRVRLFLGEFQIIVLL